MELGESEIFLLMVSLENVEEIKEGKGAVCIKGNGAAYILVDVKTIPRGLIHSGCLPRELDVKCHQKIKHYKKNM